MKDAMLAFIRRRNADRFRRQISEATDESQRRILQTLLAEEEAGVTQARAPRGDPQVSAAIVSILLGREAFGMLDRRQVWPGRSGYPSHTANTTVAADLVASTLAAHRRGFTRAIADRP